jgi:hypothetical protein
MVVGCEDGNEGGSESPFLSESQLGPSWSPLAHSLPGTIASNLLSVTEYE